MAVPSVSSPIWSQIITGKVTPPLESLAVKIFLGTAKLQLAQDSSPAKVQRLAKDLYEVFAKNEKLPSVQKDLARINL